MAWPRLRGHRSGAAHNGARSHGAATDGTPDEELAQGLQPADDVPFWDLSAPADPGQADDSADGFGWEYVEYGYPPDDRGAGAALEPAAAALEPAAAALEPAAGASEPAAGALEPADPPRPVVMPVEEAGEPRPGIGQHRGNLAHLSANPRKRAWQQRAIIAVVVMVVFSVWISWRLGLTLAIIAVIADTIYRSRRRYVRQAKLTGAQRRTRRQLAKLGRSGYRAMHGNLIPESRDQIDHLVVGPAGVFAIDSEAWDRRLIVRTKNARQLYHGPFSKKDRLEHARWESQQAADMLSGEMGKPVIVRPAMAVYGPRIPWDVATIRDVDVFSGPRLRRYLRRRARLGDVQPLTDAEVERIYRAANKAFPHLSSGSPAS